MADDITLLLGARDNVSKTIDAVEKRVNAMAQSTNRALDFARAAASLGIMVQAAEGVTKAMESIADSGRSIPDALARNLPILGSMADSGERFGAALYRAVSGAGELANVLAKIDRDTQEQMEIVGGEQKKLDAIRDQLELKVRLAAQTTEEGRLLTGVYAEYDKIAERLEAIGNMKLITPEQRAQVEALERDMATAREAAFREVDDKVRAATEAALEREIAIAERGFKAELDRKSELRNLDDEIAVARLRAIGDEEAAEIESIKRRYQARIDAASKAGEAEKADRLRTLLDLDLSEAALARKKPGGPDRIPGLSATEQRFLTKAPGVNDKGVQAAQQTAKSVAPLAAKLDRLIEITSANAGKQPIQFSEARL